MPWKESDKLTERMAFITRHFNGERISDLAREFGISRQTGHVLVKRYAERGAKALEDRSSRPLHSPNRTPKPKVEEILELRRRHPTWGPKKLKSRLGTLQPEIRWPAASTIGQILTDAGLTKPRTRRRRASPTPTRRRETAAPNELWCIDFKGQFRLGNRRYCYPLTVTDHYSRYLAGCDALEGTQTAPAQEALISIFDEYGLPNAMRSDNGTPFASTGRAGLSKLSVWFMRLGIQLERIEPGKPQQNGRHERMHLTLKQETTRPPAHNSLAQQEAFDRFRQVYNEERPHEAIEQKPPASLYLPSERRLPATLPELSYPLHDDTCQVRSSGHVILPRIGKFYLGEAFAKQPVGLRQLDTGTWLLSFMELDLAYLDTQSMRLIDIPPTEPSADV